MTGPMTGWTQAALLALATASLSACGPKPQAAVKTQEFARTACVVNGAPEPIAVDLGATPVSAETGMDTTEIGTLARTDQGSVSAAIAAACGQINGKPAAAPVTVETVPPAPKPKPHQGPTGPGGPPSIGEPVGAGTPSATP